MDAPLLRTPFAFAQPALLWGRLRLHADALELGGWGLRGRYRRRIAIADVLHADASGADRLLLWLAGGEVLRLRVGEAALWASTLNARCGALPSITNPKP